VHKHSYENEFNLHVDEISFLYERMDNKTRFEKEAKRNSEIVYCNEVIFRVEEEVYSHFKITN